MANQITIAVKEYSMANGALQTDDIQLEASMQWQRLDLEANAIATITLRPYTVGGVLAPSLQSIAGATLTFTTIVGISSFYIPLDVANALRGRKFVLEANALGVGETCQAYVQVIGNNFTR